MSIESEHASSLAVASLFDDVSRAWVDGVLLLLGGFPSSSHQFRDLMPALADHHRPPRSVHDQPGQLEHRGRSSGSTVRRVELVAAGRTAEVFAVGNDRVLKLDRLEWNGVSHFEADIVKTAHAAGLPVPEVYETVTIDGRHGIILERMHGPSLTELLANSDDVDALARHFVELHQRVQAGSLPGLPDLVARLDDEIKRSGLPAGLRDELGAGLAVLASGEPTRLCHFDLHPDNIIVTDHRWVVIDWLTAANGPAIADLARTLLLRANTTDPVMQTFVAAVRRQACNRRAIDNTAVQSWTRVLAAARLAEGFEGPYADWLTTIASTAV